MGNALPPDFMRLFLRDILIASLVISFACGACAGWVAHG